MNEFLAVAVRSLITLAVLSVMTGLLGVKHISQMTSFDYIVSIVIGSVGGALCIDTGLSIWYSIIAMSILIAFGWLLTYLNRKTVFFRRHITGTPTFLIDRGQILYEGLKHIKFNINDLLRELRIQGYFSISDVEFAIMETTGKISILPKSDKRALTPGDMDMQLAQSELTTTVIIDGRIIYGNLKAMNRTENWLNTQLSDQCVSLDRVVLGVLNGHGELSLYEKNENTQYRTLME